MTLLIGDPTWRDEYREFLGINQDSEAVRKPTRRGERRKRAHAERVRKTEIKTIDVNRAEKAKRDFRSLPSGIGTRKARRIKAGLIPRGV